MDLKDYEDKMTDRITDIVNQLNKTIKNNYPQTGCVFTSACERSDYKMEMAYYYKCEHFDKAYQSVKLIIPSISEKEFSNLHENFKYKSAIDQGKTNLLYKKIT